MEKPALKTSTEKKSIALVDHNACNDNMDVKYSAFDDQPLSALLICYKSLDNCYKFSLGKEFPSARALFTGGYRAYPNLGGGGGKKEKNM